MPKTTEVRIEADSEFITGLKIITRNHFYVFLSKRSRCEFDGGRIEQCRLRR